MVARFHLWLQNILVVNNRWCQYSIKIILWLYSGISVLDDAVFFSSCSWHALYPFTKFTDQQSLVPALLILTHAAIQVVYINTFCGMFVVC